jgi:L-methionine (R)-S-oxide reductase
MNEEQKRQAYRTAAAQLAELLCDNQDDVTAMATCAAVLHEALPQSSWTGFYRVVAPGQLRIGPYQGPIGCLEIPFDRGVCGAAATRGHTLIVDDVHSFPDHIACDASARSEIVVPLFDASENLVAVLDIDSREVAAFDDVDRQELERLVAGLGHQFGSAAPTAPPSAATRSPGRRSR